MLLTEVSKYIKCQNFYTNDKKDIYFNYIYTNSKNVTNLSIFVIKDKVKFKKKYIEASINNGAVAILTNKFINNIKVTQFVVKNINSSLSILLNHLKSEKPLNTIAVTGTNGKTSVVWYISQFCFYNNILSKTYGTLGYFIN